MIEQLLDTLMSRHRMPMDARFLGDLGKIWCWPKMLACCEATLGCSNETQSLTLWNLLNSENFSVRTTKDVLGVELCGGFKNVVALAAGFSVP